MIQLVPYIVQGFDMVPTRLAMPDQRLVDAWSSAKIGFLKTGILSDCKNVLRR